MFEWYDCDLRYCTFCCNGKCLNKKREECPYSKLRIKVTNELYSKEPRTDEIVFYSNDELRTDNVIERPRTDESRE